MAANADAQWGGNLKDGKGSMRLGSGAFEGDFTYKTRFEGAEGTNPEELVGAALAGCFSMALSNMLSEDGNEPDTIHTEATVHLGTVGDGPGIERIDLVCEGTVPGIDQAIFFETAKKAKENCPIGKALASVETIDLTANLT
ncbi:MAG: OsmC family peroxiredoxin [Microthrixaceae bacterium]|nr:OsmC family peroxiredoxin [Microthrixaceae bacterium]